jgi:PAS domain S-box-containing protein
MSKEDGVPSSDDVEGLLGSTELAAAIAEDQYRHLLDNLPVGVAVAREGRIVYINAAFESLTGFARADVVGKDWSALDGLRDEDDPEQTLGRAIADRQDFLGVFRPERAGEAIVILQAYAAAIETDDGADNFRIAALVDVGGRERAQRDLYEAQLRDRDTLLHELQHRVKNNLQLITALIRLEARAASEGEQVALARLASRIDALTVLYRILSGESAGEDIDLGQYLADIATAVMIAGADARIACETEIDYCPVSINLAMPAGLLVNEMLTNALKYAFVGRESGRIRLVCRLEGERITIVVSDDGVGLAEHVVWPSPRKLGALVLQTLKENARNAMLAVKTLPGQGAFFTLTFDRPAPRRTN